MAALLAAASATQEAGLPRAGTTSEAVGAAFHDGEEGSPWACQGWRRRRKKWACYSERPQKTKRSFGAEEA